MLLHFALGRVLAVGVCLLVQFYKRSFITHFSKMCVDHNYCGLSFQFLLYIVVFHSGGGKMCIFCIKLWEDSTGSVYGWCIAYQGELLQFFTRKGF